MPAALAEANAIYAAMGAGIEFAFDPSDIELRDSTLLNQDFTIPPGTNLTTGPDVKPLTDAQVQALSQSHEDARNSASLEYPGRCVFLLCEGTALWYDPAAAAWTTVPRGFAYSWIDKEFVTFPSTWGQVRGPEVSHETGHYFNLWHTFGPTPKTLTEAATDIEQYVDDPPGNPRPAALNVFDGDLASNVFDTPPDPGANLFGFPDPGYCAVTTTENITVSYADGTSQVYALTPDRGNVMSYFKDCGATFPQHFSADQISRMRATLACRGRRQRLVSQAGSGLPAMAASGNLTVAVIATAEGELAWTSWQLGGGAAPWACVPVNGTARLTDVAPAVSFRTTEGGASVWLAIKDQADGRVYETLQMPDGTFGGWTLIPGMTTQVSPAASDGNLAIGAPVMAVVAAPSDDLTYVNVYLADQPPPQPPAGYWQAVDPSPWTTLAPALAIVGDQGDYMFLATANVDLGGGPDLQLVLTQGNPYTPGNTSAVAGMGFASNLSPAMASASNRTVIVAADPTGAMSYNWWDLGGAAQGWTALGADVTTDTAPAVALVDNGNYLFVLARGRDGALYLNQANVGGAIVGWQPM
jgi:hypothetical protein